MRKKRFLYFTAEDWGALEDAARGHHHRRGDARRLRAGWERKWRNARRRVIARRMAWERRNWVKGGRPIGRKELRPGSVPWRVIAFMVPGQWYGARDVANGIGEARRIVGIAFRQKVARFVRRVPNPNWAGVPPPYVAMVTSVEPRWLHSLNEAGEALRAAMLAREAEKNPRELRGGQVPELEGN